MPTGPDVIRPTTMLGVGKVPDFYDLFLYLAISAAVSIPKSEVDRKGQQHPLLVTKDGATSACCLTSRRLKTSCPPQRVAACTL